MSAIADIMDALVAHVGSVSGIVQAPSGSDVSSLPDHGGWFIVQPVDLPELSGDSFTVAPTTWRILLRFGTEPDPTTRLREAIVVVESVRSVLLDNGSDTAGARYQVGPTAFDYSIAGVVVVTMTVDAIAYLTS